MRVAGQALRQAPGRLVLILVVSEAELDLDIGAFIEFGPEFIDVEIGDDKVVELEGRCFGLAANLDHAAHGIVVFIDLFNFDRDAVIVEKLESFAAPGAAGFNVEDRKFHVVNGEMKSVDAQPK